jgi:hypothetical protein
MALINPKITAAIRAATKLVMMKPFTSLAVISNDKAVSSQVNKKCGMTFVEQRLSVSYLESDLFVLYLCNTLAPRQMSSWITHDEKRKISFRNARRSIFKLGWRFNVSMRH